MMRKLVALLAVLALTAPMYADVTITLVDEGSCVVRVDYDATAAADVVAGFGFEVTLDVGTITAISDFPNDGTAYGIYPGSIDIDTSGVDPVVNSYGTPIDLTTPALGGIGTDGMSIAVGALFETGGEPALTGTLFKFTVDDGGAGPVTISVAADGTRAGDEAGGAVLLDGTNEAIVCSGLTVVCGGSVPCPSDASPAEIAARDYWASQNSGNPPMNWCHVCWRTGDVDNDCAITFADVQYVFNAYLNPTSANALDGSADNDMDGAVTFADVQKVFNAYLAPTATCPTPCP